MAQAYSRYFRRNFVLGIANGVFVNVGLAFFDAFTVLPVFIAKLGGSAALIGFVSALHGVGWFLPQIFAARLASTRRYVINMYRGIAVVRGVTLFALALSIFWIDASHHHLFLMAFIALFLATNLAGGLAAVPFFEVMSKTIPVTSRGRFFGTRRLIGGTLGIFAGVLVALVLDAHSERLWMPGRFFEWCASVAEKLGFLGHDFPVDYGILFVLGASFITLGLVMFCFAGEESAVSVERTGSVAGQLRAGLSLLRRDVNYRRFYYARICWQFTAMAFPFYSAIAYTELGFSESTVGLFLSVWVGSGIFSNYIWGRLLDFKGNKVVLLTTAFMSAISPLIALIALRAAGPTSTDQGGVILLLIVSTFFINGFIRSGRLISNITYLLEFAPEDKRASYLGFLNSFTSPFMLSPALGGLIVLLFGPKTLFALSFLFAVLNVGLSFRLQEPRTANAVKSAVTKP